MTENINETEDAYEDDTSGWSWPSFLLGSLPLVALLGVSGVYCHNSYYDGRYAGIKSIEDQFRCETIKCRLDEARASIELAKLEKQKSDIDLQVALDTTKEQAAANKIIYDSMPNGTSLKDIDLYFKIRDQFNESGIWVNIPQGASILSLGFSGTTQ